MELLPSPSSCSKLQSQSPALLEFLAGCVTKFRLPAEKVQPPAEAAQSPASHRPHHNSEGPVRTS